jgi:hypothetical protein
MATVPADPRVPTAAATDRGGGPAEVNIEKLTNGDGDTAPGPRTSPAARSLGRYAVTNTGTVPLMSVAVVDDQNVTVTCGKMTLALAESMTARIRHRDVGY